MLLGLVGAAAVAVFIQDSVGIGFALIMAPVMGLLRPDLLPVALLMLPLNLHVAWREQAALDLNGAGWITAGRTVGGALGVGVLAILSAHSLSLLIGGAAILAALAALLAPSFSPRPTACAAAGMVTGITETATGEAGRRWRCSTSTARRPRCGPRLRFAFSSASWCRWRCLPCPGGWEWTRCSRSPSCCRHC